MLESRVLMAVGPIINEFLASNEDTNSDEDGDASDWIEIHNPNSTPISLNGYYLTDDQGELTKWKFPDVSLAPNAYLLVWASDKDRADPAKPLHANLKLSDEGEYLGLVDPDGVTIASDFGAAFPPQTTDISYGVTPAGGLDYLIPTPGAANNLGSPVATVQFDHERGLYTTPFNLALSTATNGASIRYTTDGSMPTETAGTLYTGAIPIDNTIVVRAIGFKAGSTSTAVIQASYIFPAKVLQQPENIPGYPNPPEPINNPGRGEIDVPLTYGMDPNIVNDPQYAQQALDGLSQIPTLSVGVDPNHIFGDSGFYDTPREIDPPPIPMSFEFIDPNNPENNIGVGAGISAHSDQQVKRSFHVHFSKKYGPPKLKAPIFDGAPLGGDSATDEFDDLILRAGNHRSWAYTSAPSETTYTEDEYVRQTQIAMTGQGTHGMFVHLYLNGLYWGLYNVAERLDEGYGEAYFDAKEEDYFSISTNRVKSGDDTRWNYMLDTLSKQDMSISSNYSEMQTYLDVKQFADYLIGQWFCGVSDWPANNYWAGGDMSKNEPFKFYAWDGEFMMTTVDRYPTIPHGPWVNPAFRNDPGNALYRDVAAGAAPIMKLWRALKQSPEFLAMFADEVSKNIAPGGPLSDANALARWNTLNESISNAIVAESARWGDATAPIHGRTYTKGDWINATQAVANDLQGADAKFLAALHAEGLYPFSIYLDNKGTLLLRGSSGSDAINLHIRGSDGRLVASVGDAVQSFKPSQVKRIRIYGYGGNDAITVESGVRLVFADGGADNDTILGGDGNDVLFGNDGADHIEGRAGSDRIAAGVGDDVVFGDYFDGTPNYGSDTIEGNAGNDVLVGGGNNDALLGDGGTDTLIGGGANDRMSGGPGVDKILGGPGEDSAEDSDQDLFDSIEVIL
jgi:Ca2+-binding RTX toxin-like protein